jgi:hypothetical protein
MAAETGAEIKPIWPEWRLRHNRQPQIIPIATGKTGRQGVGVTKPRAVTAR